MIVVTVQVVSARTGKTSLVGRMRVSNKGDSRDSKRGNYRVEVMKRGTYDEVQRTGEVLGFPRESYSVWRLILRALKSAFPEEG